MANFDEEAKEIVQKAECELKTLLNEKSRLSEEISSIELEAKYWEKIVKSIKNIPIKAKKVLHSDKEKEVFKKLFNILNTDKCMVWGQVSCSAFLKTETETWLTYNTLYVDFLISTNTKEPESKPICVIECDGETHKDKLQIVRDEIKNLICMKAGIPIIRLKYEEVEKRKNEGESLSDIIKDEMIKGGFDETYLKK